MPLSTTPPPGAICIICAFRSHQFYRSEARRIARNIHFQPTAGRAVASPVHVKHHPSTSTLKRRQVDPEAGYRRRRESRGTRRGGDEQPRNQDHATGQLVRTWSATHLQWKKTESLADAIQRLLKTLKDDLKQTPLLKKLHQDANSDRDAKDKDGDGKIFRRVWRPFCSSLLPDGEGDKLKSERNGKNPRGDKTKSVHQSLRDAYRLSGEKGLADRIKYEFYDYVIDSRFTASDIRNQQAIADLRYPSEWFPATRTQPREIHLHVGPTNSGKTYHALQRLEQAESGVYAGPLRLLAHEVYARLNAKGKPCSLITGEERRYGLDEEGQRLTDLISCTVEMVPLNKVVDVAVIDEIQMIGSRERGWAWTQALLGVQAKEVHLCGEERTVTLIRQICASLGEELIIHRYKRLSPLKVAEESLDGELSKLRKGDCVVSFSVMGIHSLRRQIERATGKKVATVYGSLPPETRAQQARLFNDPNNDYDYLVASDAVGMGLNLAIKRIIFEAASKFNGYQIAPLGVADIKQIAGRAGRYRTAAQAMQHMDKDASREEVAITAKGDVPPPSSDSPAAVPDTTGYVTTLRNFDYPMVSAAMSAEPEAILTAGIWPPSSILQRFGSYFPPGTPFSYILTRLHETSQMHSRFHLCGLKDQIYVADMIEHVDGLTILDRNAMCSCPISATDHELWKELLPAFARCIAGKTGGDLVDIAELPLEILEANVSPSREYLRALERLHKGVVGYLWLSFRFAGVFGQRPLAEHVKALVEEKIEQVLGSFSFSEAAAKKIAAKREETLLRDLEAAMAGKKQMEDDVVDDESVVDITDREDADGAEGERNGIPGQILRRHTSLPVGGDRFGGEEDTSIDDAAMLDDEYVAAATDVTAQDQATTVADTEIDDADAIEQHETSLNDSSSAKADGNSKAGFNQFGRTPPKHLAHLETNVTELERNVQS